MEGINAMESLDPSLVKEAIEFKNFLETHGKANLLSKLVFFPHGKPYCFPEGVQIFTTVGAEMVDDVKFGQIANVTVGFINNRI